MTSQPANPQGSFVTKRTQRKSVTINEIITDEYETALNARAERFHGKKRPKGKVRRVSSRCDAHGASACSLTLR
jgi:hypothetical protein